MLKPLKLHRGGAEAQRTAAEKIKSNTLRTSALGVEVYLAYHTTHVQTPLADACSKRQHQAQAFVNIRKHTGAKVAHTFSEKRFINRDELRYVDHGGLCKPRAPGRHVNITRRIRQTQIRRHNSRKNGIDATLIEAIGGHNQKWSTKPRTGAGRFRQRTPPDFTTPHYRFFRLSERCWSKEISGSSVAPSPATPAPVKTLFRRDVTKSSRCFSISSASAVE